jgi:hypothetical protein
MCSLNTPIFAKKIVFNNFMFKLFYYINEVEYTRHINLDKT